MDIKRLLPAGRMVTLNNLHEIPQAYLEGLEKTHIVQEIVDSVIVFKNLDTNKNITIYNLDVHYLLSNKTGGYNSKILSNRRGLNNS